MPPRSQVTFEKQYKDTVFCVQIKMVCTQKLGVCIPPGKKRPQRQPSRPNQKFNIFSEIDYLSSVMLRLATGEPLKCTVTMYKPEGRFSPAN